MGCKIFADYTAAKLSALLFLSLTGTGFSFLIHRIVRKKKLGPFFTDLASPDRTPTLLYKFRVLLCRRSCQVTCQGGIPRTGPWIPPSTTVCDWPARDALLGPLMDMLRQQIARGDYGHTLGLVRRSSQLIRWIVANGIRRIRRAHIYFYGIEINIVEITIFFHIVYPTS